ncbi:hypothetical protein [Tengunoibacter tsumagoiensis]|uniref:Uncharacterized protein n=1 Tax=Tengunoibacter tsumagoiensis TaxID=2014871 RepID=A0A401ZUK9_9CHLR|nr:hypothetical protein [Tengunoibacter tsumagoiensis]GCE10638.1 hypothetical protein KTT_04970 [Tengunoibacter tsumagoiensis]
MENLLVQVGPIYLVPSMGLLQGLAEQQRRYPYLPDINKILQDLRQLNQGSGVPALLKVDNQGITHLTLYCSSSYAVGLYLLENNDGYSLHYLKALQLQDYEALAEGALWLKVQSWLLCTDVRMILPLSTACWPQITEAWQQLEERKVTARHQQLTAHAPVQLSPEQESFLNRMDVLLTLLQQFASTHKLPAGLSDAQLLRARQSVARLREESAPNAHLLNLLVHHSYLPYQPAKVNSVEALTEEQLELVRRVINVPDLLLVQAVSETSKVRALSECLREAVQRQQRVLFMARNPQILDSVLERLPEAIQIVRVGTEKKVSARVQSHLLTNQASSMQRSLLQRTSALQQQLAPFAHELTQVDQKLTDLHASIAQMREKEHALQSVQELVLQLTHKLVDPLQAHLSGLVTMQKTLWDRLNKRKATLARWTQRKSWLDSRSQLPGMGLLFLQLAQSQGHKLAQMEQLVQAEQAVYASNLEAYNQAQQDLQTILPANETYREYQKRIHDLQSENEALKKQALEQVRALNASLGDLTPSIPPLAPVSAEKLQTYADWYSEKRRLFARRAQLLFDWRADLTAHSELLDPELLRYADVVALSLQESTSLTGSEELEFDLALIEDAESMTLPDLLFFLAHSRRIVLSGQTASPVPDKEVYDWLATLPQHERVRLGLQDDADVRTMQELLQSTPYALLLAAQPDSAHLLHL